jgi:hypothetical protein
MIRSLAVFFFLVAGGCVAKDAPSVEAATKDNDSKVVFNTLDTIVADMRSRNDFKLRGYEDKTAGWYVGPGHVQMGNVPNLSNAPAYWLKEFPSRRGQVLKAILPWIVLFDGPSHNATNTRVQYKNFRLYVKSRSTKQWTLLGHSPGVGGFNTPKPTLFGGKEAENKRTNADGSVEIKPPTNTNLAWHGWWNKGRLPIDPNDIEAVFATVQARLTVDNASAPDDRAKAQLGFHVGVDYYYDVKTNWDVVNPGAGVSRVKQVTNNWQAFNFMTFSDVGVQEPGGGISEAAFRAAPPPLE